MVKESLHQNDVTIVIIYIPNIGALENIKQKLPGNRGNSRPTAGHSDSLPLARGSHHTLGGPHHTNRAVCP